MAVGRVLSPSGAVFRPSEALKGLEPNEVQVSRSNWAAVASFIALC